MEIEEHILSLINGLKDEGSFNILQYAYNTKEFIPYKSTVLYSGPYWGNEEIIAAIKSLLVGKWISSGEQVRLFENKFSEKINEKYSTMVNSGSSANLVMLLALKKHFNWKDGSEIIVSPVNFPTSIAPIVQNNMKPVFIDIEFDTLNFDVELIEEKITDKTVAIMVSPVLGNPPDFNRILDICKKYNIELVLDNCDSLGSKWNGKLLNEYAIASSCSFYPAHHMSCSFNTQIPYFEDNKFNMDTIENIYTKYQPNPEKIKILSFDRKTNLADWKAPKAIIRHKLENKKMFKIITQHGRFVEVTEDHSVFVLDKNMNVVEKKANELSLEDYIVSAKHIPIVNKEIIEIDLLEWARTSSNYDYYVSDFPSRFLERVEDRDYAWQYKERNSLPLKYCYDYTDAELSKMKIAISQSITKIPAKLAIDEDFARLIGYFIAEGSYRDDSSLFISLHELEKDIVDDIEKIVEKFGLPIHIDKRGDSKGIVVSICSKILTNIFKYVLNIATGAKNKRIPTFIFESNENVIRAFVYGYTRGDGSQRKDVQGNHNTIDVTSVSKDLLNDFQYLLSFIGISASFFRRNKGGLKEIVGKSTYSNENFSLKFSGWVYDFDNKTIEYKNLKNRNSMSEQIPITPIVREWLKGSTVPLKNSIITRKSLMVHMNKKNIEIPDILKSNLSFLKVRSIEEVEYDNSYVYDFSVENNENFYGGFLGLFLHNSTGEGGMVSSNDEDIVKLSRSSSWWFRECYCVGNENTLPNGMCKKRFSKWLDNYDGIIDHKYVFSGMGYNLKPLDLQGSIGLVQLTKWDEIHKNRKNSKNTLTDIFLKNIPDLKIPLVLPEADVSWFGTPFICENKQEKDKLVAYLEKNKIQTRNYFAGNLLLHSGFSHLDDFNKYPYANRVLDQVFFVGASPSYGEDVFNYVEDILKKYE